ncbi:hypothetical protein DV515_00019858, partial [Chloebia gouldiae]
CFELTFIQLFFAFPRKITPSVRIGQGSACTVRGVCPVPALPQGPWSVGTSPSRRMRTSCGIGSSPGSRSPEDSPTRSAQGSSQRRKRCLAWSCLIPV